MNNIKIPKTISRSDALIILELSNNGYSPKEIQSNVNISYSSIYNFLSINKLNTNPKSNRLLLIKPIIINMYKKGCSLSEIHRATKASRQHVTNVCKEVGYKFSPCKYEVNDNIFTDMKNKDASYISGLIFSDGYLRSEGNTVRISLVNDDVDILEDITNLLQPQKPIRKYKPKIGRLQSYIDISNKKIADALRCIGLHTNKSLTIRYPLGKVDDLHFIRGFFDGDGGVDNKRVSLTSNAEMCADLCGIISNNLNKKIGFRIHDEKSKSGNIYSIYIRYKEDRKLFLDWIYSDGGLMMNRKFNKYVNREY